MDERVDANNPDYKSLYDKSLYDAECPDYYADPVGHCVYGLQHGDARERCNAADILRGLGADAESAIPLILKTMREDEDHQVRAQCAFSMIDLAYKAGDRASFAAPFLIETLLTDPDADARSSIPYALAFLPAAAAQSVPALRQALGDENEWVREAAQPRSSSSARVPRHRAR